MSHIFTKLIASIDTFQEDCAELIFGLENLLGENTSIADIAVNKNPEKKKLKEADGEEDTEDTEEPTSDKETVSDEPVADEKGALRGKILRTEKELEINSALRNWIIEYFDARKQGRFEEANVVKGKAMAIIDSKNLDKETAFYRADDIDKAQGEKDEEEPEDNESDETSDNEE